MVRDAFITPAGAGRAGSGEASACVPHTPVSLDGPEPAVSLSRAELAAMREQLMSLDPAARPGTAWADGEAGGHGLTEAQCIELLRELEDLKAAAAGAQVALTARLSALRREAERGRGVPAAERGRGLASEVALARRLSPHRGGQHLGLAQALAADLPHTLAALRRGELSEWRATIVVRETICLSGPQRRTVDAQLWSDPAHIVDLGDRKLAALTKQIAYRLDPHSVTERAARAKKDRCVTIRPAPDTMAYVTALLPVSQAVAVIAALKAAADSARAAGDPRTRGQVMADTLVSRVTGCGGEVPAQVQVQLVMTDQSLFAGAEDPAYVPEHGTVPAGWARDLVRRALEDDESCGLWLRRVLVDAAGHLVAMESRSRHAPAGLAHFVATRDAGVCRTPWCDAPVRHSDHVIPHSAGGTTSADGLQSTCERCNYVKTYPGWVAVPASRDDPANRGKPPSRGDPGAARAGPTVHTTTPTGHTYSSDVPRLPRAG